MHIFPFHTLKLGLEYSTLVESTYTNTIAISICFFLSSMMCDCLYKMEENKLKRYNEREENQRGNLE
jgi:hypothetical protein